MLHCVSNSCIIYPSSPHMAGRMASRGNVLRQDQGASPEPRFETIRHRLDSRNHPASVLTLRKRRKCVANSSFDHIVQVLSHQCRLHAWAGRKGTQITYTSRSDLQIHSKQRLPSDSFLQDDRRCYIIIFLSQGLAAQPPQANCKPAHLHFVMFHGSDVRVRSEYTGFPSPWPHQRHGGCLPA